jgi:hypothetical protein
MAQSNRQAPPRCEWCTVRLINADEPRAAPIVVAVPYVVDGTSAPPQLMDPTVQAVTPAGTAPAATQCNDFAYGLLHRLYTATPSSTVYYYPLHLVLETNAAVGRLWRADPANSDDDMPDAPWNLMFCLKPLEAMLRQQMPRVNAVEFTYCRRSTEGMPPLDAREYRTTICVDHMPNASTDVLPGALRPDGALQYNVYCSVDPDVPIPVGGFRRGGAKTGDTMDRVQEACLKQWQGMNRGAVMRVGRANAAQPRVADVWAGEALFGCELIDFVCAATPPRYILLQLVPAAAAGHAGRAADAVVGVTQLHEPTAPAQHARGSTAVMHANVTPRRPTGGVVSMALDLTPQ